MGSICFHTLPVPDVLKDDVESFRVVQYTGNTELSIQVAPAGIPGIVFQHSNGHSAIDSIVSRSGRISYPPTAYVYGPGMESSVMHYKKGPSISTQIILKPHALNTLIGLNASTLTEGHAELREFGAGNLNQQLLHASNDRQIIHLLTDFLLTQLRKENPRDQLVEEGLRLIHRNIAVISVKYLLDYLAISERQFERRFTQTVGLSPQSYIRVKRFNEAVRLIKVGRYKRLTEIAHDLNFYDQSHFTRDIKAFSGMTPKQILQHSDDTLDVQAGYSFI